MKVKLLTLFIIIFIAIILIYRELNNVSNINSTDGHKNIKNINIEESPNVLLETINGEKINLFDIKEDVILLNFWATWCKPCIIELPDMIKLTEEFDGKIALVAVSIDFEKEDIKKFLKKINITPSNPQAHTYWVQDDSRAISLKAFNTQKIPETIIINRHKEMVTKVVGYNDWKDRKTKDLIYNLIN